MKSKQIRRRKKKSIKQGTNKSLRFVGMNAAGMKSKLTTFKKLLNDLQPAIFFVVETKYEEERKFKIDGYKIYELVRKNKSGGGLAIGCLDDLEADWVRQGDDQIEALSVQISLQQFNIRLCVAYGCQETDLVSRKESFWAYLDEEVRQASESETGFLLYFDGNLWAGEQIIPGDPRSQNRNGKLFQQFLERHPHLTVVNSLPICEGLITRKRWNDGKLEESVLDFFVVCDKILPFAEKMVIDEDKVHVLKLF